VPSVWLQEGNHGDPGVVAHAFEPFGFATWFGEKWYQAREP
jgi:hypothetical protein